MDIPIILRISSGSLSTPNNPRSSITYATINCEITIRSAAFAGSQCLHTLDHGPCDPCTDHSSEEYIFGLYLPQIPDRIPPGDQPCRCTQQKCTKLHPSITHPHPVVFVTCVLNTPCTLISAPDKSATKKPVISIPPAYADNMSHDWFFMLLISKNITVPSLKSGSSHPHALFQ